MICIRFQSQSVHEPLISRYCSLYVTLHVRNSLKNIYFFTGLFQATLFVMWVGPGQEALKIKTDFTHQCYLPLLYL
jgi:hypothetical protein